MRSRKRPQRAVPLPEAIDGERWEIQRSPDIRHAGVAPREKHMLVPLGKQERERLIRGHEMMHIKITPKNMDRAYGELPESVLQMVEDARVHGHMARVGFQVKGLEGVISDQELKFMAEKGHPAELAALAAATCMTGEWDRLARFLPEGDRLETAHFGWRLARKRMHRSASLPGFEITMDTARLIVDTLGDPREDQDPLVPPNKLPELSEADLTTRVEVHGRLFGQMTIEEPPLPLRLPGKMRGKRKKVIEHRGRRLHRVGRLYQDGRVFAHRPPLKLGGAVLIDTSGSMSLTADEVLRLCAAYPAGVIGAYSSASEEYGTLRVIARNGRRVPDDQIDPPGGGNGVDGPALDWLAKQPGPRYWISDAGVSGGPDGLRYCLDVCRRNQIERVDNAWDILGK